LLKYDCYVADTTAGTYSLLGGAAAATTRFSRQGSNPSPARPRSTRGQFFLQGGQHFSAAIAGSDFMGNSMPLYSDPSLLGFGDQFESLVPSEL
jgi:hypothetical protein